MTWLIRVGGIGVIIAVFGICFFILAEVLPLFGGARVIEQEKIALGPVTAKILGSDEWGRMPFIYEGGAEVKFVGLDGTMKSLPLPLPAGTTATAASLDAKHNRLILGLNDGRVGSVLVKYTAAGKDQVVPQLIAEEFQAVGQAGTPVTAVGYGDGGASKLVAALQELPDGPHLNAVLIKEKRSLMGKPKPAVAGTFDLTSKLGGKVVQILASSVGDSILAVTERGEVCYFFLNGSSLELRQRFMPFAELPDTAVHRIDYVFGDVSVVASGKDGKERVFSLYNHKVAEGKEEQRLFGETKRFPDLPGGAAFFVASQRNKTVITGAGRTVSVRYTTTQSVRWEKELPFETKLAALDGKADHLFLLDVAGTIHRYSMEDPHPEAGWRAFFGKVWYEGADQPAYVWQSTGGSDEFEPKFSLTPLIVGSLKGTFFALLFAVPIALLAAIYSGCFLPAQVKRVVKPVMELMSSLPSVVLGFLAGLWLAPILEDRVPSVLLIFVLVPATAVLCGWLWNRLPVLLRSRVPAGAEYWLLVLPVALAVLAGWHLGPWVESWAFVVKDRAGGREIADFRLWWPKVTGLNFDQRNSLVVGFMMGFAVIPVIFTIADDALSNVPPSLRAASMALGATRWQVVRTVVLTVASAGLFSAVMIGFGRAVGETMIVVMATGNTPVMDFLNAFTGMRTLSANIAVELPEASVHSTHFRTLFLGAMILFSLTFVLNTAAEVMRQRLKEKYKIV
ncbi:MAG: binding-protein-dependent transport system inner rane component [Verrucomicrobiaceae bacterium]|nr:binding-protein-dependent transport system inner rane component [Verrucomicrobiaceae bacterium]